MRQPRRSCRTRIFTAKFSPHLTTKTYCKRSISLNLNTHFTIPVKEENIKEKSANDDRKKKKEECEISQTKKQAQPTREKEGKSG